LQQVTPTINPVQPTIVLPSPTRAPTVLPTATVTPAPTATVVTNSDLASKAAQDYFSAVQAGDFSTAADLISSFSRFAFQKTSGDFTDAFIEQKQKGVTWSDLKINETQPLDAQTILVHVTYQTTSPDVKTGKTSPTTTDEFWPMRLENGAWRVNWNLLIDFKTLTLPPKTANGLTIVPLQLTRYSNRITLSLMAQNSTAEVIVLGQPNQVLATFHFGDKTVDAEQTQTIVESLRTNSNVLISVKGLFNTYPDTVDLIKYKNYPTQPLFTFSLGG
jgi:hypothetical protein